MYKKTEYVVIPMTYTELGSKWNILLTIYFFVASSILSTVYIYIYIAFIKQDL